MRFVLSYMVLVLLFCAQPAFAQETLRVRAGEHKDYSRLVFDWNKRVSYDVDKQDNKLVITFKENASVTAPARQSKTSNIDNFKILSESPLKVSVSIPKGARTRDFYAGDRVVIDVYSTTAGKRKVAQDPETPKPPLAKKAEKKAEPAAPPVKPQTKSEENPEEKPDEKQAQTPAAPKKEKKDMTTVGRPQTGHAAAGDPDKNGKAVPVEAVEAEAIGTPGEEKLKSTGGNKAFARPNLITVSSTRSQGLAVFELNNEVWIVNDQTDLKLTPQVSGPDSEKLLPVQTVEITGGKAFKTDMLEGYKVRGQGGGLLWRVILSPENQPHEEHKPVEPVREGVYENESRSGKILWPFDEMGKILEIQDPVSGANLKVVTVKNSKLFAGPVLDFIDFTVLHSPVGLTVLPKVDDLEVRATAEGVEISRPGGLAILSAENIMEIKSGQEKQKRRDAHAEQDTEQEERRIYDFKSWQMGGVDALGENGVILLGGLHDLTEGSRVESFVTLAKMHVANAQGAEALGFLRMAQGEVPELLHNPEFLALRGAAKSLDWKSEPAFVDLSSEALKPFQEIGYWRAVILADLGDWAQARDVLPKSLATLYDYPELVFNRLALVVAEILLRDGNVDKAEELLGEVEQNKDSLFKPQAAALAYLKGEAARQRGKTEQTKKLWKPLTTGEDDLYRAKAGLALTRLRVDLGELEPIKAIDNLERLRYAWRGDQLEAQINYWLGRTYFEAHNYVKGLNIMREAAGFAAGTHFGQQIAAEMTDVFTELFLGDELKNVPPPDAAALYEQFSELVPIGEKGDKVVEMLADHLMKVDLLDRAASLLDHQLKHRLTGAEAQRVAVQLAAIYLLDNQPKKSMKALSRATTELQKLPEEMQTRERFLEISLLRARALSKNKRADQALALLNELPRSADVNNLRADIAWEAGYWDDAAEALQDVILDRDFSLTRPLEQPDAELILHRAVALNLAGDRVGLANMREKIHRCYGADQQISRFRGHHTPTPERSAGRPRNPQGHRLRSGFVQGFHGNLPYPANTVSVNGHSQSKERLD